MIFIALIVWYILTAVLFFAFLNTGWKSIIWFYYVKESSLVAIYIVVSILMLLFGYFLKYFELYEYEDTLKRKENDLKRFENELDNKFIEVSKKIREFENEKSNYELQISSLEERYEFLSNRVKELEMERERYFKEKNSLKKEYESLLTEKNTLEREIKNIIKMGYQKGYNIVIDELRSLRAQKSAVLDLFDEIDELNDILKKHKGVDIRRFLEIEKKKRLKDDGRDKG